MALSLQSPWLNKESADGGTSRYGAHFLLADVLEEPGVRGENINEGYATGCGDYDDADD
jgi:hypothetical protein